MDNIIAILTSKDREEVKNKIKDLIVEQTERDIQDLGIYLVDPDVIHQMINEVYENILEELKPQFKKLIKKKMEKQINQMQLPEA